MKSPPTSPRWWSEPTTAVPFLFRTADQKRKRVTHVALCNRVWHQADLARSTSMRRWIARRRIERFARKDRRASETKAQSYYVVACARRLMRPIPFERLELVKGGHLSPNMERGYAIVLLPPELSDWYKRAIDNLAGISDGIPPL